MSSQADVEAELARLKSASHAGASRGPSSAAPWARATAVSRRRPAAAGDSAVRAAGGGTGVIVRILGEGQYDVADDALARLNELDATLEARRRGRRRGGVRGRADRPARRRTRRRRPRTPPTRLDESDLILPPADATIDEVRELLGDDGLIPG